MQQLQLGVPHEGDGKEGKGGARGERGDSSGGSGQEEEGGKEEKERMKLDFGPTHFASLGLQLYVLAPQLSRKRIIPDHPGR